MTEDKNKSKKKAGKMPVPFKAPTGYVKGIGPKGQYLGGLQPGIIGGPKLSNPAATIMKGWVSNSKSRGKK